MNVLPWLLLVLVVAEEVSVEDWLDSDATPSATKSPASSHAAKKSAGRKKIRTGCTPDSNYRFPFKPNKPLPFCSEYSALSCCDDADVKAIERTVGSIVSNDCPICRAIFAQMKCSECHPESFRFWKNEQSSIRLCRDFCHAIYDKCRDIPLETGRVNPDGSSGAFYLNDGVSVEEFCNPSRVADEPDCYRGTIPEGHDTKCKCPSHNCHVAPRSDPEVYRVNLGEL